MTRGLLGPWLLSYLRQLATPRPAPPPGAPRVLHLALADHFEPFWRGADLATARERLRAWEKGWPEFCARVAAACGQAPKRTFFYPAEEYHPELLDRLAALCARGLGEVEIHLHHGNDTREGLKEKLLSFAELLHNRHGLLRREAPGGAIGFGFVHGNWALDNSLPGGAHCGVNDELTVLRECGCYADFTLPAAPSPAQTRTINAIYYATDDPRRPKSHDRGSPARVGRAPRGDLLLVQGVLCLNPGRRKFGLLPKLENSDIGAHRPYAADRIPLWLRFAPQVAGAPGHRFLKLSSHGAQERHFTALFGPPASDFFRRMKREDSPWSPWRVRFCTCREMVAAIHQLERGEEPTC